MSEQRLLLTVNAGSTSVRLALFALAPDGPRALVRRRASVREGGERELLDHFLADGPARADAIALVAHRVVHGGRFRQTIRLDDAVRREVAAAADLAPLHNPPSLAWASACQAALPEAPALAVFDTTFYDELPAVARTYGLPRELSEGLGLRRLGFHGLAHRSMWQAFESIARSTAAARPLPAENADRVISLQLGGGCSATALRGGRAVDTSMGFSPLEGLLMASRPGDLDAGLLLHVMERQQLQPAEMRALLHRRSGLLGISGISGDIRQLLASPAPEAALAVDVFCHRVQKYLGAYLAILGGCDAVLVGGGAGEASAELRRRIFAPLGPLGMRLDERANAAVAAPGRISAPDSPVQLWVIPTDEESILAEEASAWLDSVASSSAPGLHS